MDIRALHAVCASQADHYRVQIHAENLLAPAEIIALDRQKQLVPEPAQLWVRNLARMTRAVRAEAQAYRRHDLAENVAFYEGQGAGPRSLVVAFTGVGQRMMVPAAPFLQGLPAARCDVVLLRDPDLLAFLNGVPGYAADLPALAERLHRDLPGAGVGDRRCIGASSGAAAALAFGPVFGAATAVGLGGLMPEAMLLRQAPDGFDRGVFTRLLAASAQAPTRLICAYGQTSRRDVANGTQMATAIPACRTVAVAGVDMHGLVGGLMRLNAWGRFVQDILLGDTPTEDGVWSPAA